MGVRRADDAVLVHLRQWHLLQRQHGLPVAAVQFGHLGQCARWRGIDQVVRQEHREGLVLP